jgi:RNA polymerase sigma factor (sigma-70 family)
MSEIALPIAGVPPGLPLPGRLCSDERLARLVSGGSERALTVLYERHHQALYRYCRSIVRDHDDAQDALQSTMTRAFAALQGSERELAVRPWLFRIAHNEAISILRQRHPNDCLVDEHLPSDVSVERTVDQRERLQLLVADLNALPVRQRAALVMRELSGLPIEEIAVALSVSPGAARQTLFEARSSLHEFAEGRVMECETARRAISDGDGRVLRGRKLRAHLRGCEGCREFGTLIDVRTADLRMLVPPLPASAAAAMLGRVLAHGASGGHAGGAAATSGAALGSHAVASLVVKGLVGAAVLAAASAGTLHLVRGPAKHEHTSTFVSPVAISHAGAVDRASLAHRNAGPATVALTRRARSIAAAAVHSHISPARGGLVATAIQSEVSHPPPSPAIAAAGQGKGSSRHIHGGASGGAGRGSSKGQAAPRGPRRGSSHRVSKPIGSSTSPQPQGRSHSGGSGHTPQAHQAPVGQQPAGGAKEDVGHQPTTAAGTPPVAHHDSGIR